MNTTALRSFRAPLPLIAATALFTACADNAPVQPAPPAASPRASVVTTKENAQLVARIRRATDRYHELDIAIKEGFVKLHDCEVRSDGPVGTVYVHPGRVDGIIDATQPEALIYEPQLNRLPKLVGVEFVIPYALWTRRTPPKFFGATFQPEDEFQVYALHAWVWRNNPNGLFAETNPTVSCGA